MTDKNSTFRAFVQDSPGTSSKLFDSIPRQDVQVKVDTPGSGKRLISGVGGDKLKLSPPIFCFVCKIGRRCFVHGVDWKGMTALLFQVKLQYKSVYREEIRLAWGGGGTVFTSREHGGERWLVFAFCFDEVGTSSFLAGS